MPYRLDPATIRDSPCLAVHGGVISRATDTLFPHLTFVTRAHEFSGRGGVFFFFFLRAGRKAEGG
jgi:hypothetical protein